MKKALVLRQPQLAEVKAEMARYEASLKRAEVELGRAKIVAPFDAQLLSIGVTEGSLLRDNTNIMNLVATDTFWLRVNVPPHQLRHINIPDTHSKNSSNTCSGAKVTIHNSVGWAKDDYREGCVMSLLPNVDSKIKTAVLIIEIADPLALRPENKGKPKVLINSVLQANIEAKPFKNVVAIERKNLQQGNFVWVMNNQKRLEARQVSIAFRDEKILVIDSGLNAGDRIITSSLPGAVEGIAVKAEQDKSLQLNKRNKGKEDTFEKDVSVQTKDASKEKKKRVQIQLRDETNETFKGTYRMDG
ncbi:efflux RND transporter periplasmic adaptor subunit [Psychromonas sp. KJ10-10]|uniref:efflux RND transporter periplasmic adaptor subunit n=1 Tax=Psychromonas sp. KJ10-10 TaxID=3391823 RepID=UPI0039B64712